MGEFLGKQVVGAIESARARSGCKFMKIFRYPPSWWSCWTTGPPSKSRGPNKNRRSRTWWKRTARTVIKGYRYNGFHEFVLKDQKRTGLAELGALTGLSAEDWC